MQFKKGLLKGKALVFVINFILFLLIYSHFGIAFTLSSKSSKDIQTSQIKTLNNKEVKDNIKNILIKRKIQNCVISRDNKRYCCHKNCKIITNTTEEPSIAELHFQKNKIKLIILK